MLKPLFQIKQHDAANDPFQCLVMKPIYARSNINAFASNESPDEHESGDAHDPNTNIFKSVRGNRFVGISILVATINDGYLYQFSNNGVYIFANY